MKKTKENSEHYKWGDNCSGWHLINTESLSVIEELMPPNTREKKHHHKIAQQFFRILKGKAIFEIENEIVEVEEGKAIHIQPNTKHRIRNDETVDLEFLVISQPNTRRDRFNEEYKN